MRKSAIVVGAGPVGLMLACELRLGEADVVVYERLLAPTGQSRGASFTRRTAEVLDQRGVLARLGHTERADSHFGGVPLDLSELGEDHYSARGIPQFRTEQVLTERAGELGVPIRRGFAAVGFSEDADGVVVRFAGPGGAHEDRAGYLIGCDGSQSVIRKLAGIDFRGPEPTRGFYSADVTGIDTKRRRIGEEIPGGSMVMAMDLEDGVTRIVVHEVGMPPRSRESITFGDVADAWKRLTGESIHHAEVRWLSTFTDASRLAVQYRRGRVFLAGDAAHIQPPAMALGLSVGVQDAVNLGWKLAAVLRGGAPAGLLETYHDERHPVGEQLMRNVRAAIMLRLTGEELEPLRSVLGELVGFRDAAGYLAGMVSGLSIRYEMGGGEGGGHPLVGLRLPPDLVLARAGGGRVRAAELLRRARGVLVAAGGSQAGVAAGEWGDRVDVVEGEWVRGSAPGLVSEPDEVLVRPDGYVAWASPGGGDLPAALHRWFGSR